MFARVLVGGLLGQIREADALRVAPPQQVDDYEVEESHPLAEQQEVPERREITAKG